MKTTPLHTRTGTSPLCILAISIIGLTYTGCEKKPAVAESTLPVIPSIQASEPAAKTTTVETARVGGAIDTFERTPTPENQSSVNLAFSKLDGEIAELNDRVVKTSGADRSEAAAKSDNLKRYRDAEMIRFTKAQRPIQPVTETTTFETTRLRKAIDAFEKAPTVENQSSVKLAFADLNGEVAELEDRVVKTDGSDRAEAAAKSANLQKYRDAEMIRFAKVQQQLAEPVAKAATVETTRLSAAIDAYEKAPTVEHQSTVKLAFAEVDGDIVELKGSIVTSSGPERVEAATKLKNLTLYCDAEMVRFTAAQDAAGLKANAPADTRSGAQKIKDTAEKVGDNIEIGAKKVGKTLEKAAKNTGEAIKEATH